MGLLSLRTRKAYLQAILAVVFALFPYRQLRPHLRGGTNNQSTQMLVTVNVRLFFEKRGLLDAIGLLAKPPQRPLRPITSNHLLLLQIAWLCQSFPQAVVQAKQGARAIWEKNTLLGRRFF